MNRKPGEDLDTCKKIVLYYIDWGQRQLNAEKTLHLGVWETSEMQRYKWTFFRSYSEEQSVSQKQKANHQYTRTKLHLEMFYLNKSQGFQWHSTTPVPQILIHIFFLIFLFFLLFFILPCHDVYSSDPGLCSWRDWGITDSQQSTSKESNKILCRMLFHKVRPKVTCMQCRSCSALWYTCCRVLWISTQRRSTVYN